VSVQVRLPGLALPLGVLVGVLVGGVAVWDAEGQLGVGVEV